MKDKIISSLSNPKKVISIGAVIALIVGVFVFKTVGIAPAVKLKDGDTKSASILGGYQNGDEINLAFPKGGRVSSVSVKIGDVVKKGDILASLDAIDTQGMLSQAKGALGLAQANYEKVLNGATGADVDVLKAAEGRAEANYNKIVETQKVLVKNAYDALLNSSLQAIPENGTDDTAIPLAISGAYNLGKEGSIALYFYPSDGGTTFVASGLVEGTGLINISNAQPIGSSGLYLKQLGEGSLSYRKLIIQIPNKKAPNYLANFNAYQSALRTEDQLVTVARAELEQAKSVLLAKQLAARPEDIAIAKAGVDSASGAVHVAEGALNNDFIYAPEDGLITVLNIKAGEIAAMNQRIVSMVVKK